MQAQQLVSSPKVTLRRGRLDDAKELGRICYAAFDSISRRHGNPCDFQNVESATGAMQMLLSHPEFFYSVVAEDRGKIVGSNFLHEWNPVTGVGPITVDPSVQNKTIGRELMLDVIRRSNAKSAPGIRLVQAAYHMRSLSLYTKLGFETRETLSNFQWAPIKDRTHRRTVRRAVESDLQECNGLCSRVHGHDRSGELLFSVKNGNGLVVDSGTGITGYSTGLGWFGHSVGESDEDIMALISTVNSFDYPGILVPSRNYRLMRWLLDNGLRINQQMTLMIMGLYNDPQGAYLPSVIY